MGINAETRTGFFGLIFFTIGLFSLSLSTLFVALGFHDGLVGRTGRALGLGFDGFYMITTGCGPWDLGWRFVLGSLWIFLGWELDGREVDTMSYVLLQI